MTELLFANADWMMFCLATLGITAVALGLATLNAGRRRRLLLGHGNTLSAANLRTDAVLFAAFAVITIALLGPRFGHRNVLVSTAGVDAVVLLDVSKSMLARDVPPSRLQRARRIARGVLERLEPSDRAALAVYSGRGVVLTPLSPDTAALVDLLPAIDSDLISPGGSDLGAGVERALTAFDTDSERSRVLVIVSDGEAIGRSGDAGVGDAVRANTRVVGVALGSELGTTIPNAGAPLVDRSRRVVITRRRQAPLAKLADATSGRLLVADEWGAVDLDALTREIRSSVSQAVGPANAWIEQRRTVPVVLPFAAVAFGLLWLLCTRPRVSGLRELRSALNRRASRRQRPADATRRTNKLAALLAAALSLLLIGAEGGRDGSGEIHAWQALARVRPLEDTELLRLGLARARMRHNTAAAQAFEAVALGASQRGLAAIAYHDLGVLALERGELETARQAFEDAIALAPGDPETRFNLEWTLRALAEQPPPAAAPPRGEAPPEPADGPAENPPPERSDDAEGEKHATAQREEAPEQGTDSPPREASTREAPTGGERAGEKPTTQRVTADAPHLDAAERQQWLQRIQDDPSRALRSAAADDQRDRDGSDPTW